MQQTGHCAMAKFMNFLINILIIQLTLNVIVQQTLSDAKVRVAVYQHHAFSQEDKTEQLTRNEAKAIMQHNLAIYQKQTELASKAGAKIIVFPVEGLLGSDLSRRAILPYLEKIPRVTHNSKINDSDCSCKFSKRSWSMFKALSCIASKYKIYLVAGIADLRQCPNRLYKNTTCEKDGKLIYNTVIALNPMGCLVAKHYQSGFMNNKSPYNAPSNIKKSLATFTTPFGNVALFTGLDLLFQADLLEKVKRFSHPVHHVACPTAWKNIPPLLSAVHFHSGWALRHQVNLLVANDNNPVENIFGSGIYSSHDPVVYTMRNTSLRESLLVAEINVDSSTYAISFARPPLRHTPYARIVDEATRFRNERFNDIFYDTFTFRELRYTAELTNVCSGTFCCFANYSIKGVKMLETFAIAAFSGVHTFSENYYLEVCLILKCRIFNLIQSCGEAVETSRTKFSYLYLDGSFSVNTYVYPQVILNNTRIPSINNDVFFGIYPSPFLEAKDGFSEPLITMALYGRNYDNDIGMKLQINGKLVAILYFIELAWIHLLNTFYL